MTLDLNSSDSDQRSWKVDDAKVSDKQEILALFTEVFGQPMSESLWEWKYGNGRGCAVVARRDGKIIAHYGGVRRDVVYQGRLRASIQCVDTMVNSGERSTLTRRGPYFLVASQFLDRYVGYDRPFLFGFGFPNHRVMRLGERVGIQASVGEVVEPAWSALRETSLNARDFNPDNGKHHEVVCALWRDMRESLPDAIVGVRDVDYIRYRYLTHPDQKYQVLLLQRYGVDKPEGLIVVRREGERLLLLDLVGRTKHFPKLVEHARYQAGQQGCKELTAWVTEHHIDFLGSKIGRVDRPGVRIPTSVCTDGPSPDELRGKWWLTAGDTDFK